MDVKQAVGLAKAHIADLFSEEAIADLGLEEVEFNDAAKTWSITVGFTRPWDRRAVLAPQRVYKVVRISDAEAKVLSVKHRNTVSA